MCISKAELDKKVQEIRSLKALKEETENQIKALENEVISFLEETEECQTTNKKGEPMLQYIGSDYKATYAWQSRETVNKEEVKKILSDTEYQKVSKINTYPVLRIS